MAERQTGEPWTVWLDSVTGLDCWHWVNGSILESRSMYALYSVQCTGH